MNVQTLRKAIASVSATALLFATIIVPGMGVNVAQAEWYDVWNDAAEMSEVGGFFNASANMTRGEFFELVVNAALVAGWIAPEDFTGNHAETLVDLDVIQGQGGTGNLDLNGQITKEAALKVLMILVGLVTQDEEGTTAMTKFTDVPKDSWFAIYVSVALDNGYIRGEGGSNSFGSGSVLNNAVGHKLALATLEVADEATGELLVTVTLSDVLGELPTPSGDVVASLASDTPAGRTVALGDAKVHMMTVQLSGTGTLKGMTLKKVGVANPASVTNIYVFDSNGTRLTDGFSLTSDGIGKITGMNLAAPAKIQIYVSVDGTGIATGGEELQFQLISLNLAGSGEMAVTSSVVSGIFRLAAATIASFTTAVVTPSGGAFNPGEEEQVLEQFTLTINTRDVDFWSMTFENIGSAPNNAFQNLRLLIDGVEIATATALDENSRVVFSVSTPVRIKQGARVVQLVGLIVAGSNRTHQFSLRQPIDIVLADPTVNAIISATVIGPIQPAVANVINLGTCTVIKDPENATSGLVVMGATNVVLGRFRVKCYGESVKANTIRGGFIYTGAGVGVTLRNGHINIGPVGSTSQQGGTAALAQAGTLYATNFIFEPGLEYEVDVVADTFAAAGAILAAETIQATLVVGAANAQLQSSRGTINFPAATVAGNTLTLSTAAVIAMAVSSNYPSQNVVAPSTRLLIAEFNVSNGNVEDINVTNFVVALAGTVAAANLVDLIVVFDGTQAPIQSAVGTGGNFAVSKVLKTNQTVKVQVYVTVLAGAAATQTIITTGTVNGTTSQSGVAAASAATVGQTMTIAAGTITLTRGSNSVNASITPGNKTILAYEADVSTLNDSFIVNGLTINLNVFTTVTSVIIKKGGTTIRTFAPAAATVLTGLDIPVGKNVHSYFTIELVLGNVGVGAGTSGESPVVTIAAATALNSNGTQVAVTLVAPTASNAIFVFHDVPTLTGLALVTTLLTAAADKVAAKFKVEGNVVGTVGWANFTMAVNKSAGAGKVAVTGCYVKKLSDNSTVPGVCTVTTLTATDPAGTLAFAATNEEIIPAAGETYELHVTTTGAPTTGDTFSTTWNNSGLAQVAGAARATVAGTATTFVWSDRSAGSHSLTTLDWYNDGLVKNLPITNWNMSN